MLNALSVLTSFPGARTLLGFTACVALFTAEPAYARSHVHPVAGAYEVDFHDLDLQTDAGRAELMHRLVAASRPLCDEDTHTIAERDRCVLRSVSDALATTPKRVQQAMRGTPVTELAQR